MFQIAEATLKSSFPTRYGRLQKTGRTFISIELYLIKLGTRQFSGIIIQNIQQHLPCRLVISHTNSQLADYLVVVKPVSAHVSRHSFIPSPGLAHTLPWNTCLPKHLRLLGRKIHALSFDVIFQEGRNIIGKLLQGRPLPLLFLPDARAFPVKQLPNIGIRSDAIQFILAKTGKKAHSGISFLVARPGIKLVKQLVSAHQILAFIGNLFKSLHPLLAISLHSLLSGFGMRLPIHS